MSLGKEDPVKRSGAESRLPKHKLGDKGAPTVAASGGSTKSSTGVDSYNQKKPQQKPAGSKSEKGSPFFPMLYSIKGRLISATIVLLSLVQTIQFLTINESIVSNAKKQLDAELTVAQNVTLSVLGQNGVRLLQAASVLVADFGFKEAVQTADGATITSVLENHSNRIGAPIAIFVDPEYKIKSSYADSKQLQGKMLMAESISEVSNQAKLAKEQLFISVIEQQAFQFVKVPMRAPNLVGYVLMGFPLESELLVKFKEISDTHSVLSLIKKNDQKEAVSSLIVAKSYSTSQADSAVLTQGAQNLLDDFEKYPSVFAKETSGVISWEVEGGEFRLNKYLLMATDQYELAIYLIKSTQSALLPYKKVQQMVLVISLLGIGIFIFGAVWVARRVSRPIEQLVLSAKRLGVGDFNSEIPKFAHQPEMQSLSVAFDNMRINIAQQKQDIERLAYWDKLTGLPNVSSLRLQIQKSIKNYHIHKESLPVNSKELEVLLGPNPTVLRYPQVILLILDMNRIKQINDVVGYAGGDEVLKHMGSELKRKCAASDIPSFLARLSGDEFAILLPFAWPHQVQEMINQVHSIMLTPIEYMGLAIDLDAAVGFVSYPVQANSTELLMSRAEIAMYEAKRQNATVMEYHKSMDSAGVENISLLGQLRTAIAQGQLRLFIQPKVNIQTLKIVGAEALVRWQHPERGLVPPLDFIPFAEQTGFIHQLTLWVFEEAAKQMKEIFKIDPSIYLSINLSAHDLMDARLIEKFDILMRGKAKSKSFCLEITESAIMNDPNKAQSMVEELRNKGYHLSIDDFGTGYSSLAYLKRLKVHELKIDKSFVMNMLKSPEDASIVRSTIDLAHNLGLLVVAEGVENTEILHALNAAQCDIAQGYGIAKPMSFEDFLLWLSRYQNTEHDWQRAYENREFEGRERRISTDVSDKKNAPSQNASQGQGGVL